MQKTNILRTFVPLLTLIGLLFSQLAFADKKEKEWPPMPQLDTLVGDTSGAITIRDSALIPTFGIYPANGWGKMIYIDTNTFNKYGLVVFFNPWDESSRQFIRAMGKFRQEFEEKWGFDVYLVACRMSVVSCRPIERVNPTWLCQILLLPNFDGEGNNTVLLKKSLEQLRPAFPVYRLREPLRFEYDGSKHFSPATLTIKGKYVFAAETNSMGTIPSILNNKFIWRLAFSALVGSLEEWQYETSKGGEKK